VLVKQTQSVPASWIELHFTLCCTELNNLHMDKQCATARAHHAAQISKLRSARVCVCFVHIIYTPISFAMCVFVGCLVHGARTRALFQLLYVHVHFAEGGEQISAHFLSHADDSCIESAASGKDMLCGFPHYTYTLGEFSRTVDKATQY
jgi:hypothetical protein